MDEHPQQSKETSNYLDQVCDHESNNIIRIDNEVEGEGWKCADANLSPRNFGKIYLSEQQERMNQFNETLMYGYLARKTQTLWGIDHVRNLAMEGRQVSNIPLWRKGLQEVLTE